MSLEAKEKATHVTYRQKVWQHYKIWANFPTVMLKLERVADKCMHLVKEISGKNTE